jgi:hypothetical protein
MSKSVDLQYHHHCILDNLVIVDCSVGRYQTIMSLKPISNFIHRFTFSVVLFGPSRGTPSCHPPPPLMASLCQSLRWWDHPCVSSDVVPHRLNETALSIKKPRRNMSKASYDFLVLCELCLTPCAGNPNAGPLWLVDELPKLQPYLKLCRFAQTLLKPGL